MIITHHREKVINAIIYFAKNTQYCGKTKLMKLLYFLDFCHFKQTGKSVTGLDYFAWEMGPVPKEVFQEISCKMKPDMEASVKLVQIGEMQKILARRSFDGRFFTNREKKILENVAFIFRDAKAEDMIEATHLPNQPWERTLKEKGEKQRIDFMLSIDETKESLPYGEARERAEEIAELRQLFGVV
jgi:uncharacterized phage-associated protein